MDREDGRPVRAALSFGERLVGAAPMRDTTRLVFGRDEPVPRTQCTVTLRRAQLERLWAAARESYVAQLAVDGLPVTVALLAVADMPGAVRRVPTVLTRRDWTLHRDARGAITDVHANATAPLELPDYRKFNASHTFTYTVTYTVAWRHASPAAPARAAAYRDTAFFRSRTHVFSVFNACCAALFLAGAVVLLLVRRLRSELFAAGPAGPSSPAAAWKRRKQQQQQQRQDKEHADSDIELDSGDVGDDDGGAALEEAAGTGRAGAAVDLGDESGWKQIRNDVFRAPRSLALFAATVGTGWQVLGAAAALLLLPCVGLGSYFAPGSLAAAAVLVHAVFALLGGFKAAQVLGAYGGARWIRTMLLQGTLLPAAVLALWALLAAVAAAHGSVLAPRAGTWARVVLLGALVALPLTLAGTLLQRRTAPPPPRDIPSSAASSASSSTQQGQQGQGQQQTSAFPSQIPPKPWYASRTVVALAAGLPAFGTAAVELHYVCAAYASYWWYYTYGCAAAVLACTLAAAAGAAVLATFALLSREDYRWPWTAFFGGASTGLYALLLMLRFYARSQMAGAVERTAFFAFALVVAATLALACGTAAYTAAAFFVRRLYRSSKTD